ncbi:penicillin-binding protein [Oceaniferula spumae]|uniref:Penicillin-binding protein n=1 Tax=Oceaniferula spumae TaxID=2979115 RepID=A0AAT9FLP3_9BACT
MSWKPANQSSRLPAWVPERLHRPLRWLVKWGLISSAILLAVVLFYFYLALQYNLNDVARMPERSVILDRNGEVFGNVHGERRRLITREEIPDVMVEALRAREDLRFYDHCGVDVKGLARATLRNIKDRSFTQGASTLTMQLARNSFEMRAKSLHRKFLEIAITLRIENHYKKDEILAHYLNRIYFGAGCHGVEEAAQTYFERPTSELNTGECAMIVGIIRGPHLFSPFRNLEGAKAQRDEVLERMQVCGFLTEEEKEKALQDPIRLASQEDRHRNSSYARESIRLRLQSILDQHDIRSGGLKIHTTLDTALQTRSSAVLKAPIQSIQDAADLQAALVVIDPGTGGILAICGGRDYEESPFNRAWLAKRDLGPAFTPFLEAMALERSKVVVSGNPVQTGRQLGVEETLRLSHRLGFGGPFQKTEDLYRGAIAASPMEVACAASAIVQQGERPEPHLITAITDSAGRVLYEAGMSGTKALSKAASKEALDSLKKDGGKLVTCTSSRRDGWAVAFKPEAVTVLWLGYDDPKKIATANQLQLALSKLLETVK